MAAAANGKNENHNKTNRDNGSDTKAPKKKVCAQPKSKKRGAPKSPKAEDHVPRPPNSWILYRKDQSKAIKDEYLAKGLSPPSQHEMCE